MNFQSKVWTPVYANDLDAFIPEIWAQEGLLLLENNMVAGNLVHRDFEPLVASFGDVVNTRLPASFTGKRKADCEEVDIQDAVTPNVAVPLNQHLHTSFLVCDGEESKGFQSLRDNLLAPAMLSLAQMVDEIVLGEVYQFLPNSVGQLGVTPTKETVIGMRNVMNSNKVPMDGRNLIVTSQTEADLLAIDAFVSADKIGDEGTALREGSLGRKYGILHWMSQNTPSVPETAVTIVLGAINNGAGHSVGDTALTVDGLSAAIQNGSWCLIAGDGIPHRITASVGGATPTQITITPALKRAVADDAEIEIYTPGQINLVAGYANGYSKSLTVDGFAAAPSAGQLISLGVTGAEATYGALSTPSTTSILLGRPLEAAAADDTFVAPGPPGNYNFGFHKNALALVTRPLAAPQAGAGAMSFVASYNGLSMRVTITYDGRKQGHLVTCDLLCGVKVLDQRLGAVMLG
ncbi:hypothetical protein OAF54_02855 [bacterium]|nr:hypothetical protein [bacterium]